MPTPQGVGIVLLKEIFKRCCLYDLDTYNREHRCPVVHSTLLPPITLLIDTPILLLLEYIMPLYDIRVTETGEEKELMCTYSELKEKINSGEWEQIHKGTASIVTHVGGTLRQTSDGWKDILKTVKKNSGRSNTIRN